jgi:hypothetical protein
MQMLLRWAIRFVEDLADDIIPAYDEYLELRSRTPDQRRSTGRQNRRTLRPLTFMTGLPSPGREYHPRPEAHAARRHLLFDHKATTWPATGRHRGP